MNIQQQLDATIDLLEPHDVDAAGELIFARTNIVAAVASMRLAMDDPSCIDEIEPGTERRPSTMIGGRTQHRDPTADAALVKNTARTQHRDLVNAIADCHRSAVAGKVKHATGKAYAIAGMVNRWLPRHATGKERMTAARDLDPGCISCARTEVVRGTQRWEQRARGDLCRWCDDWKRKHGEVPTVDIVEQHHRGRVRVPA